ncbi:MAG: ABC transporter substrate-binding protein, partial [Firmicutes bacterium]|nr:ABC transporter substrate-binding protein [Bacillota bacterium]
MKRFLSILLLIAMVFTFAACGQDAAPADNDAGNTIVYGTTDEYTEINPAINEHCEINVLIF